MKAMLMTAVKQPLSAREIPDPQPGPGQVRVRLRATGVCGTDIHVWHGELPVPLPIVPGHEPVGTIDAVGPAPGRSELEIAWGCPGFKQDAGGAPIARRKKPNSARSRKRGSRTAVVTPTS